MNFQLDAVETRILGCLMEKERLTPEIYPLSLNSLTNACNQSSSRDPVVAWDESTVEKGLDRLREKKFVAMLHAASSRVPKYRHHVPDLFELDRGESALLCILLLRGPQTSGELRTRSQRMHSYENLEQVEAALSAMGAGDDPLVKKLPARPGQKEQRFVQLLSAGQEYPDAPYGTPAEVIVPYTAPPAIAKLEGEIAALRAELQALKDEFAAFRAQF